MEKPPMDWIDKVFDILESFFGDSWRKQYKNDHVKNLLKGQWQSALTGLSREQIRTGLNFCKSMAFAGQKPPHGTEFFLYCKGKTTPYIPKPKFDMHYANKELAKQQIAQIKSKLSPKYLSYAQLSEEKREPDDVLHGTSL